MVRKHIRRCWELSHAFQKYSKYTNSFLFRILYTNIVALFVEVGLFDHLAAHIIGLGDLSVTLLRPRRIALFIEVGLFDLVTARVIRLRLVDIAVLRPCRVAFFIVVGFPDAVAAGIIGLVIVA